METKRMVRGLVFAVFALVTFFAKAQDDGGAKFAPATLEEWQALGDSITNAAQPQIAFESNGVIYVINQDGTDMRRIVEGYSPSFSPDGREMVYADKENGNVSILNVASGAVFPVMKTYATACVWGRDDRIVVVTAGLKLVSFNPDGSGYKQVVSGSFGGFEGMSVSADGKKIALASVGDIYVIEATSGMIQQITEQPTSGQGTAYHEYPSFGPDGRVYYSYQLVRPKVSYDEDAIWVMNSDGSGKRIVSQVRGATYSNLTVAPGDPTIFFEGTYQNKLGVYSARADGSDFGMVHKTENIGSMSIFDPRYAKPTVLLKEDVNKDGKVDIVDLVSVAREFGGPSTGSGATDIDGNGQVDIVDLVMVARKFGDGSVAASPALLEKRDELVRRLGGANSKEEIDVILQDFVPSVTPKGKKAVTWGEMKSGRMDVDFWGNEKATGR